MGEQSSEMDNINNNDNMKNFNENDDFNVDELDIDNTQTDNDDFLTIDQIEDEINKMEELADVATETTDDLNLDELENELDSIEMESDEITDEEIMSALDEYNMNIDDDFETDQEEIDFDEFEFDKFAKNFDADELELSDEDIEEGHGISHARRKGVDGKLPRKGQGLPTSHERQLRYAMQENMKLENLLSENKKLTKKTNELRKESKSLESLVEQYKTAIGKYREQLKEMAVFNTNLSHVNNLLVNENITMSHGEKVDMIKEFTKVSTIEESKSVYSKYLTVLTENKKSTKNNINESIVGRKLSNSVIDQSSKTKLDEVTEKNAYTNNQHLNKIKSLIGYVEKTKRN